MRFFGLLVGKIQDSRTRLVYGKEHVTDYESFYDISDVDIKKNEISMSRYKGKVLVLVLNVASK